MTLSDTKRLTFRRFDEKDAHLLFQLDSDTDVMKYITLGKLKTKKDIRNNILPKIIKSYDSTSHYGIFSAFLKLNGDFIGWFQFEADKLILGAIEIGWRLKKNYWGNGYATEGAKMLVSTGRKLNRLIVAQAMIENKASIRVMEKAGLTFAEEFWGDYKPHSGKPDVRYELKP